MKNILLEQLSKFYENILIQLFKVQKKKFITQNQIQTLRDYSRTKSSKLISKETLIKSLQIQYQQLIVVEIQKMLNSRLQNIKESAYFDYFKSFSFNANDTLKKLQQQFRDQIEDEMLFESNSILKKIKTLLGSYEILIYQINDSCEFVEIPQFGACLVKIFLQVMSIIKFLLIKFSSTPLKNQQPQHSQHMHMFQRSPSMYKKKTMALSHNSQRFLNDTSPNHFKTEINQKQIYKQKEQSKFTVFTLNQQLSLLQIQQSENLENSKKQLRSLIQGKQKLQNIQISQNQNILTETLNSFCKKGEHLKNFVSVRQAAMMNNMKESGSGDAVIKVRDILNEDSAKKVNNASVKLQTLFKNHIQNYIKQKQSQMQSFQCQVTIDETLQQLRSQENKQMKKLIQVIKKLRDEIDLEKQKNKSIENLLKSKTEEFQVKTMEYRIARIEMDNMKVKLEKEKEKEKELAKLKSMTSMPTPPKESSYCDKCRQSMPSVASNNKSKRTLGQLSPVRCYENDLETDSLASNRQKTSNGDELQQLDEFNVVEAHSKLKEKINRNRVHFQIMSTNNLSRKNPFSQFIHESLQKKIQLLELCSNELEIAILPNTNSPPKILWQSTRLLNIASTTTNRKKTVFSGRPFQTQEVINLNSSSTGNNGNEMKKKTTLFQQKIVKLSLHPLISFSFTGLIKKQPSKHKPHEKKLSEIKSYIKKLIQQLIKKDKQYDKQSIVQQLAQKLLQYHQLIDTKIPNKPIEKISQTVKGNTSDQQKLINIDNKDINKRNKDSSLYRTMGHNRGRTTQQPKRSQNNGVYIDSQDKIFKLRNSSKLVQAQKNYELSRVQSHASMRRTSMLNKSKKTIHQSQTTATKFPQVPQAISQSQMQLSIVQEHNNNITCPSLISNYPKFIKLNSQQKLTLTMIDMMNLFIDIGTAKNFEYINLFQNDQVRISNTIKIKKNNAMNPTQQQLKKKNIANVLIKKTIAQHHGIVNQYSKMGIHSALGMCERDQSPFDKRGEKGNAIRGKMKNNGDNQMPCYTFEPIASALFKQMNDIRRIRHSQGQSSGLTIYQTIRNFLRYPYSAVSLVNDKQFIEKQRHESVMEYLQLRRILQRVFKLHKDCPQYSLLNNQSLNNNDEIKGKQNMQSGQQRLCSHVVLFFQKVGIQLFPTTTQMKRQ